MENQNNWSSLAISTKFKYISIIIIAVLFTIFTTQNLETIELDVFFWTFNVRFVFALIFCFFIGVFITYFWMKVKFSKKEKMAALKKKEAESKITSITEEK
jgi:uncharacterized integral membrane protein